MPIALLLIGGYETVQGAQVMDVRAAIQTSNYVQVGSRSTLPARPPVAGGMQDASAVKSVLPLPDYEQRLKSGDLDLNDIVQAELYAFNPETRKEDKVGIEVRILAVLCVYGRGQSKWYHVRDREAVLRCKMAPDRDGQVDVLSYRFVPTHAFPNNYTRFLLGGISVNGRPVEDVGAIYRTAFRTLAVMPELKEFMSQDDDQ
ncbi:hypothetical protein GCM10022626_08890 [[Pseudomonas] carboxydohydrogena]